MRFLPRVPALAALAVLVIPAAATPSLALTAQHRLDHKVVPTAQSLRLEIDPQKSDYSGNARITIKVAAPTDSFQLNAHDMNIRKLAVLAGMAAKPSDIPNQKPIGATYKMDDRGILTVHTKSKLNPGSYTLDIDFTNDLDVRADALYKITSGGDAYVASQFEANSAREAFPCWDEPEFKIPWQVTMVVPAGQMAISNAPVAKDEVSGGRHVVTFQKTPPMSSYLLALLAGPYEAVPIPGMSAPGRVVTTRGQSRLADMTVKETPKMVGALEKYFGQAYPYKKLDLIALPEFQAGAMENPGAITFRDRVLLNDPRTTGARERKTLITFASHELAHMWFGDYVTMRWWDDLWLNESFASWMGDKITQEVAPEYEMPVDELEGTQEAMLRDAQRSTRPIRANVDAFDNLNDLFDELHYQKGQAVLGMIEHWLGPDKMQQGVRAYLKDHAWGNATAADLWKSLGRASGQDVAATAGSFLDQGGLPLVSVEVLTGGRVRLRQQRFANLNASVPRTLWRIPVVLKYSTGGPARTQTVMLADSEMVVTLEGHATPKWIHPNAEERGYYHWTVDRPQLRTLVDSSLRVMDTRERVGFVNNLSALVDAGELPGDESMRLLAHFGDDPRAEVVAAVTRALDGMRIRFVTPELERPFASYVRRTLTPAWTRFGDTAKPGESAPVTLVRPQVMVWLAIHGQDAAMLERGKKMAESYLKDPTSVDPSMSQAALMLAAYSGDAARFEEFRTRFEKATDPNERSRFLFALGAFKDPALVRRALDYNLTPAVRPNEMRTIPFIAFGLTRNEDVVFDWMRENYAGLSKRLPPWALSGLMDVTPRCSSEKLAAAKAFFAGKNVPGIAEEEAKATDRANDCLSVRRAEGDAVARYLNQTASGVATN
jgi:alanyl aminopeptidase